jgi:hypothetical protein
VDEQFRIWRLTPSEREVAVLLRQLPYAHSERLVRVFTEFPNFPNGGLRHFWVSPPEFLEIKRDAQSFDAVEGWANFGANLAGASEPVRATAGNEAGHKHGRERHGAGHGAGGLRRRAKRRARSA